MSDDAKHLDTRADEAPVQVPAPPLVGAQRPADAPDPSLRFRRSIRLVDIPADVWRARSMVRALTERELRATYKQAALGMAWAVMSPVTLMIVFTVFIKRVADVDTNGVPYALFSYVGLVPWSFFSSAVSAGGVSIISQLTLVNKLRCPREVFPLSSIATAAFNSAIAVGLLVLLFPITGTWPKATTPWALVALPALFGLIVGVTLLLSSVTVYLRDLRHALPIVLQLGLFATPVAYGLDAIPTAWQNVYCFANPLAPVIDTFRRALLMGQAPNWTQLGLGTAAALLWVVIGAKSFRRLEPGFADVA
jgi:ABC-type polysaccharide/polyol phosphate export permease